MSKKFKERFISTIIIALVIFSLLGCGIDSASKSEFKNPQDLANAYVEALLEGDFDAILRYMPTKMIESIAKENNVSIQEVQDSLIDEYNEAYEWDCELYEQKYDSLSIYDVKLHELSEDEIEHMKSLRVGGYRYSGLFKDGAEEFYGCYAYDNSGCPFWYEFIIVKIDGLWYVVI